MGLGSNIQFLRKQKRITQEQLALAQLPAQQLASLQLSDSQYAYLYDHYMPPTHSDSTYEDNLELLTARMNELGLKPEDYQFYLDLRKYGSARHAGFGLGFERCVMYLTGMGNIRDVIPFPRTVNNCDL